jgi:hypothetical protein
VGSNSEVGGRNREVRFIPESRLNSDIAACPFGAKPGSRSSFHDLVGANQDLWRQKEPDDPKAVRLLLELVTHAKNVRVVAFPEMSQRSIHT